MFLKRIVLKDVRCIRELDLSFDDSDGKVRKWTLLLGENGCGKSTILRALALLLGGSEALAELLGEPGSWIRTGCRECRIYAELVTANNFVRNVELKLQRPDGIKDVFERNKTSLQFLDSELDGSPSVGVN